jgi:hypothetical protein
MKALLASWKSALAFFGALFAVQTLLFFFSPTFYLGTAHQTGIPAFIKFSFVKHFAYFLALYLAMGIIAGALNALLLKLAFPYGEIRQSLRLLLLFSQLCLLLLAAAWQYPTLVAFLPSLETVSLGAAYLVLVGVILGALFFASLSVRPVRFRGVLVLILAAILPTLLHGPSLMPDRLDLPKARIAKGSPSVLLLGFDAIDGDHGHGALGQAVKELGLNGRFFLNAFTPLPATHPAWNSILSGSYPENHGVRFFFSSPLQPNEPQLYLPKQLKLAGYHSIFTSDQPETSYFDAGQGFDHAAVGAVGWEAHLRGFLVNHFLFPALWLNNGLADFWLAGTWNTPTTFNYDPARFFNEAFRGLSQAPLAPLLLALHSCHLHTPIRLTREELSPIKGLNRLAVRDFSYWRWSKPGDPLQQTPELWHNPYYLRLPHTLEFIRALAAELKAEGYFDAHLIVFLSDHGERFVPSYEIYGGIHGIDLETRGQSNVMMAVFAPNFSGFDESLDPAGLIDLAPTLLTLLGWPGDLQAYDGAALLDARGNFLKPAPRPLKAESMGLIEKSAWAGRFPQIPVEELEANLLYDPLGPVTVGPKYYEAILKRKEFADLLSIPGMLERNPKLARGAK